MSTEFQVESNKNNQNNQHQQQTVANCITAVAQELQNRKKNGQIKNENQTKNYINTCQNITKNFFQSNLGILIDTEIWQQQFKDALKKLEQQQAQKHEEQKSRSFVRDDYYDKDYVSDDINNNTNTKKKTEKNVINLCFEGADGNYYYIVSFLQMNIERARQCVKEALEQVMNTDSDPAEKKEKNTPTCIELKDNNNKVVRNTIVFHVPKDYFSTPEKRDNFIRLLIMRINSGTLNQTNYRKNNPSNSISLNPATIQAANNETAKLITEVNQNNQSTPKPKPTGKKRRQEDENEDNNNNISRTPNPGVVGR